MHYISGICVVVLGVAMMFAQQQDGQQPAPRVTFKPGRNVPAPPAQPEPGDRGTARAGVAPAAGAPEASRATCRVP